MALCEELSQWRKSGGGGRGKRIPEGVWQQAAAVARVDRVVSTARATGLRLERLQACVASAEAARERRVTRPRRSSRQGDDALASGRRVARSSCPWMPGELLGDRCHAHLGGMCAASASSITSCASGSSRNPALTCISASALTFMT